MQSPGIPAWTYNDDRQAYYLHNFLIEMPDLNLDNKAVRDEIKV